MVEKQKLDIIEYDGLVMSWKNKEVCLDGKQVPFTRTEFYLLWHLLSHPGHVFSRDELISNAWPTDVIVTERTVDVNITRIRKKTGRHASSIKTKQGFGYGFCP